MIGTQRPPDFDLKEEKEEEEEEEDVEEELDVVGTVMTPLFSTCVRLPPTTLLEDAINVIQSPSSALHDVLGTEPLFKNLFLSRSMHYNGRKETAQLRDLLPDSTPITTFAFLLDDPKPSSRFSKLAKNAADGRAALAQNVQLATELQNYQELNNDHTAKKAPKNEARVPGTDTVIADLVARLDAQDAKIAAQDAKIAAQDAKIAAQDAKIAAQQATIAAQQATIAAQNIELEALRSRVQVLEKTTRRLNRRIALDQAREKILMHCNLRLIDFISRPDDLVRAVESRLWNDNRLSSRHLNLIFKQSSVRQNGNAAAHEADLADISLAVLSTDLTPAERDRMVDIYKYTYGVSPTL